MRVRWITQKFCGRPITEMNCACSTRHSAYTFQTNGQCILHVPKSSIAMQSFLTSYFDLFASIPFNRCFERRKLSPETFQPTGIRRMTIVTKVTNPDGRKATLPLFWRRLDFV